MSGGGQRPEFAGVLRIVPYSGVQVVDTIVSTDVASQTRCHFVEDSYDADGESRRFLLPIEISVPPGQPHGALATSPTRIIHPVSGKTIDPSTVLSVDAARAIAAFSGRWLPIPYLRFIGRDDTGVPNFDAGPANWARARIAPHDVDAGSEYKVALAFDTSLGRQSRLDSDAYLLPTVEDAAFGSTFVFTSRLDDLTSLLSQPWFEHWLQGAFRSELDWPDDGHGTSEFRHIAAYLTLLRLISAAEPLPELRFTDTVQGRFPVRIAAVDLVLDIGDQDTIALLVDGSPTDGSVSSGFAEHLRMRDLSAPNVIHVGPFPTAAEFAAAPFGDTATSYASGRIDAFAWPSLVRIGHEARRLSLRGNGTEGVTGLSNLRSFLLDDTASPGLWRQSTENVTPSHMGPMVSSTLLGFLGEDGTVLGSSAPIDASGLPALVDQRPAIRPRFSRSAMVGFFAAELVLHAIAQANDPSRETGSDLEAEVRELRQIVVLTPTTLSPQERQALASRIEQGVAIAWRGLGWDHPDVGIPKRPHVALGVGGDLGTQIAFLHSEVTTKYQGRFDDMMRIYSRSDVGSDTGAALRIASIDFGSRTTTLAIVDYAAMEASSGGEWQPIVRTQERLPIGTDAVVQTLIWSHVLPAIERALAHAGLSPARHFLDEITGRSTTSLLIEDPYFTRRLNRKVLWPAGQGLLQVAQYGATSLGHGNRSLSLATLVALGDGRLDGIAEIFDAAALQAGARGFILGSTALHLERGALQRLLRTELQQMIGPVAQSISSSTCDLLLLGGEGVRLSAVMDTILSLLPVPAGRIVDLDAYAARTAGVALRDRQVHACASMLPAIAAALDMRDQLAASGLAGPSIRQLAIASGSGSPTTPRAVGATSHDEKRAATEATPDGRAFAHPTQRGLV